MGSASTSRRKIDDGAACPVMGGCPLMPQIVSVAAKDRDEVCVGEVDGGVGAA